MPDDIRKWGPAPVNATWKVMVNANDVQCVDQSLLTMAYILTDTAIDYEKAIAKLKALSGKQIIEGLLAYRSRAYDNVNLGLKAPTKEGE